MELKVKRLCEKAKLPTQAHRGDAGWDLYCIADDNFRTYADPIPSITLQPGDSHIFHTGISCSFDEGYVALLWDRSGMGAKRNIHRLAGVIDATYRDEWLVSLINLSKESQTIVAGDKIIQVIFQKVIPINIQEVQELDETERNTSGFGSSGR